MPPGSKSAAAKPKAERRSGQSPPEMIRDTRNDDLPSQGELSDVVEGKRSLSKRGAATFDRVMRIVAAMYRERGYERTSMTALARRIGVTAPAIYHYFGSKEEILAAFLDYTVRDLISSVTAEYAARPRPSSFAAS